MRVLAIAETSSPLFAKSKDEEHLVGMTCLMLTLEHDRKTFQVIVPAEQWKGVQVGDELKRYRLDQGDGMVIEGWVA